MSFSSSVNSHPRTNPWKFCEKIFRIGRARKWHFFVSCYWVFQYLCFCFSQWKSAWLSYEVSFISALVMVFFRILYKTWFELKCTRLYFSLDTQTWNSNLKWTLLQVLWCLHVSLMLTYHDYLAVTWVYPHEI